MKNNRHELEERIDTYLYDIKTEGLENVFIEEMSKKNVPIPQSHKVLGKLSPLTLLSDAHLMAITMAVNVAKGINPIDLNDYYTELEIKEYSKWKYPKSKEKFVKFENVEVFPNTSDQFFTFISTDHLIQMFDKGQLNYNFDTQRDAIVKIKNNQIYKTINIVDSAVKEIAELIMSGDFIPNDITFNVLKDGTEDIVYNQTDKTLTIKAGELDVLDGMHRTLGINKAKKEKPELNMYFGLNITNFDINKAQRYIVQEDKKNPISKEHIKRLNDDTSRIVLDLIKSQSKDFKQRIAVSKSDLRKSKNYVISEVEFREFIELVFDLKTARDAHKIAPILSKQFDNLVAYVDEQPQRKRGEFYTPAMFVAYMILFEIKGDKMATDEELELIKKYNKEYAELKLSVPSANTIRNGIKNKLNKTK